MICDYIYLKENQQERRPHDPNKNFAPGEFTKLFQKVLETVDLIFKDGIDWQAFLASFQNLQVKCGSDELTIQSFENKGDGAFVIRVNVPRGADKAEIEKYLKRQYQLEAQLEAKNEQLANLMEITKLLAGRPIQNIIENKNLQGDRNMTGDRSINMGKKSTYNERLKVKRDYIQAEYYAAGQNQSLTEAAAEIKKLLEQLDKSYSTDTMTGKMTVATEVIKRIESNPTLMKRIVSALKAGSISALEQALNHPAASFVVNALQDWQQTKVNKE